MAEQMGFVIDTEKGGWARVLTNRKSACGGCHSNQGSGCRSCLAVTGARMEIRVENTIGACKGDVVKIALPSSDFFKGAALLYIAPILALLIGALSGAWAGVQIGWQETSGAVLGGAAGIGAAVYALLRVNRSQWTKRRLAPKMIAVLSAERSSTPKAESMRHACCGRG